MLETLIKEIIPVNDAKRLEALRRFDILYSPAEVTFDRITQMMAQVFKTPMAFISLVDKNFVFYKSQVGPFGRNQVNREDSLCSLTILGKEPLIIEDASGESCFTDNPYVAAEGGIKFYAGAPLITSEGYQIGTACIVDTKPRTFSIENKRLLVNFAEMVMHEIEVRHASFRQIEVQEELSKAQAQLLAALEVGKITPWHWDVVSNKVYGDAALAKMFGIDGKDAALGLPVEEFIKSIHPDDQAYVTSRISLTLETGQEFEAEYRVYDINKEEHWVIGRGRVRLDNKLPVSLTGSIIDITEKKRVEEEVKLKSEALTNLYRELQFVVDTIPQLAWIRNADGTPAYLNQGWAEYTGIRNEDLIVNPAALVLHPDDTEAVANAWKKAIERGDRYEIQYRLKRHDGVYRWFLGRGTPLKDSQGNVIKWYGTSTDIHDQKTAAQILESEVEERTKELIEANNHLQRINADLEQFTYVSHHDLQEPIRKILMFTDMVRSEEADKLSMTSQLRLEKVLDAARRMSTALKEVLNYAALSKEEQFSDVDLEKIVDAVVLDLELVIAEKHAKITIEPLPTIKAIPQQMHQLFYNLVNNALKFSKTEEPPHINITCRKLSAEEVAEQKNVETINDCYEIAVSDNGIGFEQHAADKIFGLFQRLHTRQAYAGTGIGLALCKKIAQNHHGAIWGESEAGKGATFKVLFPAG